LASQKRKPTMFRLSVVSHEPPGHTPPAFLFLSSTMSKSRKPFGLPASRATKHHRSLEFGTGRAVCSLLEAHLRVSVGRATLSETVYMLPHSPVSRHGMQKFLRFSGLAQRNPLVQTEVPCPEPTSI